MNPKSLLIIDGHAIAHRAYHSIPRLTHQGKPVNLIYGFYSMLLSALKDLRPDYLAVCLDSPGPVFRNQEFIGYRAKRRPPPADLVAQLPQLQTSLNQSQIPNFALGGYEADDLIATLVSRLCSKKSQINTVIVTGDKDLFQLVTPRTKLFVPTRGLSQSRLFDPKAVYQKLGIKPSQIIDYKALAGDQSDNYPGVSGIGPKTAASLLSKYQNLDNIYQHLSSLPANLARKLKKDKDNAYLSRKLAQLVDDVPLKIKLSSLRLRRSRFVALLKLFRSYNFRSLASRLQKLYPQLNSSSSSQPLKNNPRQTSLF